MESHPIAWGLDIGHTSVKAVKLQRQGDGVSVIAYSIEPIQSGEDVDREEAVVKALQTVAMREEMRGTPVFAALSGRQIFSRSINVPVINPKKVDKMVELEARQQIPGDFDEVRWHYHLSPAVDGVSNDVALFAARKDIVDDLIAKCGRAGIHLVGISISSLAVYNFVRYDQDFAADESVVTLDIGAENTDLVVFQGDTLWMRTIGVSGNDITRAFMKKFRVSFEEAETLKCQVGDSRQVDRILKVVEPSLAELVSDVQRSLGFYKSAQNKEARFENVVVSGNTFKLPGLTQFMADRLGYAIIELVEMEKIGVDPRIDRTHFLEDLQSLGVAMGLALQGIGVSHAKVNLLPSSKRIETLLRTKRWAAATMLALIFVTWLGCYIIQAKRLEQSLILRDQINRQYKDNAEHAKDTIAVAKSLIKPADAIKGYRDYGAHSGLLHQIEAAVFDAAAAVARERGRFMKEDRLGTDPLKADQDPVLQPLYIDSLSIPTLEVGQKLTPFQQLQRSGTAARVTVQVRVPAEAEVSAVRDELKRRLEEIRIDDVVWRARNPGVDALPPLDQRPPLFVQVEVPTQNKRSETWVYHDPNHHFTEPEEKYGPYTVTHNQSYYFLTYDCTLVEERKP